MKIQVLLKGSIHPLTSVKFIIVSLKECVNTRIAKRICLRKTILWSKVFISGTFYTILLNPHCALPKFSENAIKRGSLLFF